MRSTKHASAGRLASEASSWGLWDAPAAEAGDFRPTLVAVGKTARWLPLETPIGIGRRRARACGRCAHAVFRYLMQEFLGCGCPGPVDGFESGRVDREREAGRAVFDRSNDLVVSPGELGERCPEACLVSRCSTGCGCSSPYGHGSAGHCARPRLRSSPCGPWWQMFRLRGFGGWRRRSRGIRSCGRGRVRRGRGRR